ncbi:hypothetical protein KOR42_45870 [Thalassoglobus neptunius]|uniref:Uncharacterized protein n=1 Tax=Thalassoglobus neptunius TaxID=1938619 RepID=A0A5C5VXY0_9PLAN|nr:hypothetical protein KOR42_45870 [Thalassoglobus neptunius]
MMDDSRNDCNVFQTLKTYGVRWLTAPLVLLESAFQPALAGTSSNTYNPAIRKEGSSETEDCGFASSNC